MLFRVLILLILWSASFSGFAKNDKQTRFLVLTDIHFDPFIMCQEKKQIPCPLIAKLQYAPVSEWASLLNIKIKNSPGYHQDTSYPLLVSALSAAKKASDTQNVRFVLVLGDMLGHGFRKHYKEYMKDKSRANYRNFVKKTFLFLNNEIAETFPNINVYSLVGNNDSYRGNYRTEPNGVFFYEIGTMWAGLIKNSSNRISMQQQFNRVGYYALDLPTPGNIRLLMLNTVLFSTKAQKKESASAAKEELDWLHRQLLLARDKHQRVLIAMHIPEGVDVYASLRIRLLRVVELWLPEYTEQFQRELKEFAPEIVGILAGHLHADWYQVQRFDNMHEIPILGTPSISPVYGNNPGFKIYSYSNVTREIDDFTTYYYPLNDPTSSWKIEYDFSNLYKPNCVDCPITEGIKAVPKSGSLANHYKKFYSVNTTSQPITQKWDPYYWCAIREVNAVNYQRCIG